MDKRLKPEEFALWYDRPETKRELLTKEIRDKRDAAISLGVSIEVNGRKYWTDRDSQQDMGNVLLASMRYGLTSVFWSGDGWAEEIPIEELDKAAIAVFQHVQAAFKRRDELKKKLEALPVEKLSENAPELVSLRAEISDFWEDKKG